MVTPDLERAIVSAFTRPLRADETIRDGSDNREREIRALFTRLEPMQAFQLRRRLDLDRNDDPIAMAFRRIVVERRQRLRDHLASPRRQLG